MPNKSIMMEQELFSVPIRQNIRKADRFTMKTIGDCCQKKHQPNTELFRILNFNKWCNQRKPLALYILSIISCVLLQNIKITITHMSNIVPFIQRPFSFWKGDLFSFKILWILYTKKIDRNDLPSQPPRRIFQKIGTTNVWFGILQPTFVTT